MMYAASLYRMIINPFFFFNDPAPPESYPLPLHASLPIPGSPPPALPPPTDRRARSSPADPERHRYREPLPPPTATPGTATLRQPRTATEFPRHRSRELREIGRAHV